MANTECSIEAQLREKYIEMGHKGDALELKIEEAKAQMLKEIHILMQKINIFLV